MACEKINNVCFDHKDIDCGISIHCHSLEECGFFGEITKGEGTK